MSDISYLKHASTEIVADACRQYGALAFMGNGLTELQKLETLSSAVQDLNNRLTHSEMFFTTIVFDSDLFASVVYAIEDFNDAKAYVRIKKTITYKTISDDIPGRPAKVEMGPVMPRARAQAVVDAMNAQ